MSERAFHMTPAQAEILRELLDGTVAPGKLTLGMYGELRRKGWITPRLHVTGLGREALRQYEEGQSRAND